MKKIVKNTVVRIVLFFMGIAPSFAQTSIEDHYVWIPGPDGDEPVSVFNHLSDAGHNFTNANGDELLILHEDETIDLNNNASSEDAVGVGNFNVFGYSGTGELHVDVNEFPDYVFDDSYALMSLSEIERYVTTHKHLPGIPSAAEFQDGMEMVSFNLKLLEKIEELTLHVIEQQTKLTNLNKRINQIEAKPEN